ncbi:unnamed protein product, partial [Effrenium voratum]
MPKDACKEVKHRFRQSDISGDGKLDHHELSLLLRRGDPSLRDSEVRQLFRKIDQNGDGRIDFGEFCDYVFGEVDAPVPEAAQAAFESFSGYNDKMSSTE